MGRASKARKRARQREKRLKHGMVLTKRTPKNKKKWETPVNWQNRKLAKQLKFKIDNLNKQSKYG